MTKSINASQELETAIMMSNGSISGDMRLAFKELMEEKNDMFDFQANNAGESSVNPQGSTERAIND